MTFNARIIRGAGRGRSMGSPTINLALEDVPSELGEGVYAVQASLEEQALYDAVMHYGPRPTFEGSRSCEVHFLEMKFKEKCEGKEKEKVNGIHSDICHRVSRRINSPANATTQSSNSVVVYSRVTVKIVKRLRDVRKFSSVQTLREQIMRDIEEARMVFQASVEEKHKQRNS